MTAPLFVDVSPWQPKPLWQLLAALGAPWHGAILKVSEGLTVARTKDDEEWFAHNWRAVQEAGGMRYGFDWFRGGYHFLRFDIDGAKQADVYLRAIDRAGGFAMGDLWPIVDVELGSEKHPNHHAEKQQIIDCTEAFVARVKKMTGRDVMLYGNGAMRDRGITSRMGCEWLWCPRYTAELPRSTYERSGWTQEQLVMWQFGGGGETALAGYPSEPPGFGPCDVSVLVKPDGLAWLRGHLWPERPAG